MIERKFTTEFTVKRMGWTTEVIGDKTIDKTGETTVGTFNGYRQQASADYIQSLGLQVSKPHVIWCPTDTNVVEGDVIQSTYGSDRVKAIQINRDGQNTHRELIVEFIGAEA